MDPDDMRQWMALGSHIFPESYEQEAAHHRAFLGKSSLEDIGSYGFGDPFCNNHEEDDDDTDDSEEENDDADKFPSWYNSQPFQYNGRMQLISLPGFILIIAITGDLLIGIVTFGSIVIYLLHVGKHQNRAFFAFIVTFFMCHFAVLYSLFPLLWDSFFNFFFLLFVNIFVVLTGAWFTLQFEEFYSKEIDITRKIESFLYCGYPLINITILTWVSSSLTNVQLAPYFLLLFGFCILQIFLHPARSSFVKPGIPKETAICEMILEPEYVGLMGLIYAIFPPVLYVMITITTQSNSFFTLNTLTELTFLGFTSFFLSTLLDLRPFFQVADCSVATVNQFRWVCGVVSLLLLSPTLTLHGLQLYFLPSLSVAIIVHASYAYLLSHKKTKVYGSLAVFSLLGLHIFVFNKLPWQMTYYFSAGLVHISLANSLLFATCILGMLVIYLSVSGPKELFSGVFLLHTIMFLTCEHILLSRQAYPLILMVVSAAAIIYAGFRLQHSSKLSKTCNWIMVSVQLTKAIPVCDHLVAARLHLSTSVTSSWWIYCYSNFTLLLFTLVAMKALFFEDSEEISFAKWKIYVLGSGFAVSLQTPMFLPHLYWIAVGSSPTMSDVMAVAFGFVSLISIRLGMQYPNSWIGARYMGPTLLALAVTVTHLQPQGEFRWSEIWKWLVLFSVLAWFTLLPLIANIRNVFVILILSVPLGAPPALVLMYMCFGGEYSTATLILSPLLGSAIVGLIMIVWRGGPSTYKHIMQLIIAVTLMAFIMAAQEGFSHIAVKITAALCFTVIAISTKVFNLSLVNLDADAQLDNSKLLLASTGNICSCLAFYMLYAFSQLQDPVYAEIMTIGSSGILLVLQREGPLRRFRQGSTYAPVLTVIAWVLWWSSFNDSLWWSYRMPVHMLIGFVEMTLLFFSILHYIAVLPIFWIGKHIVSTKVIVFLLPVQFFLLIFANSYWAWLFLLLSVMTTIFTVISGDEQA